jgi:toxin ParE1/3/4
VPVKPVIRRAAADRDVEAIVDRYLAEAGVDVALKFVDALEAAFNHLSRHPATGSPRYGHQLNIPGLRSWPLSRFPHLVFYFERTEDVEVWRVLHGKLDVPAWLELPGESAG